MPINTQKTGEAIAAHRQRLKLSQQGLAELMNVTHQAVSKWEKGLALPDTETLLALSKLFETSMEKLLLGHVETENVSAEEIDSSETPKTEESAKTQEEQEPSAEPLDALDFASLQRMLPFVSAKVADRLFETYTRSASPDVNRLRAIAPFVSTCALNDYILAHPLEEYDVQMLCGLAPFLPTATVDTLIRGLNGPVPPHMMHALLPFASTAMVDQMVLSQLAPEKAQEAPAPKPVAVEAAVSQKLRSLGNLGEQISRAIEQKMKVHKAGETRRESVRMKLARRAVEEGNTDWLCQYAAELDSDELKTICRLALDKGMYDVLEEVIDELDEEFLHEMADRATETDDAELLEILSENI